MMDLRRSHRHQYQRPEIINVFKFGGILSLVLLILTTTSTKAQGQDISSSVSSSNVVVVENDDINDGFVQLDNVDNLVELNNGASFVMEQLLEEQLLLEQYSFLPLSSSVSLTPSINYKADIVLAFQKVTRGVYWKLIVMIELKEEEQQQEENQGVCLGSFEVLLYFLGDYTIEEWGREYTCEDAIQIQQGNYIVFDNEGQQQEPIVPGTGNTGGGSIGGGSGSNTGGDSTSGGSDSGGGIERYTGCCYEVIEDYNTKSELINAAYFVLQQLQRDDIDSAYPELRIEYSFLNFFENDTKYYLYTPIILDALQQVVGGSNWKLSIMILSRSSSEELEQRQAANSNNVNANANDCIGVFDVYVYSNYAGELSLTEWGNESPCSKFINEDNNNEEPSTTPSPPTTGDNDKKSGAGIWTTCLIFPAVVAIAMSLPLMSDLLLE